MKAHLKKVQAIFFFPVESARGPQHQGRNREVSTQADSRVPPHVPVNFDFTSAKC